MTMTELCAWCGRERALAEVELTVAKAIVIVPLCGKHYAAAILYEQLGLQGFLRGLVQRQLPRGVSKTVVPRIRTRAKKKR